MKRSHGINAFARRPREKRIGLEKISEKAYDFGLAQDG